MAQSNRIHWHLIFLTAFGSLVLLVLCHVLFVAYYSLLMDVGHDQAYYSEFAQNTGPPFVFFFGPVPIFLMMRWVGKKVKTGIMLHAALYIAISLLLDLSIVALAGQIAAIATPGFLLAHLAKISAALTGAWSAQKEQAKLTAV